MGAGTRTAGSTLGDYALEARLGSGRTGVVWRARRGGDLGTVVAIKRLRAGAPPEEVQRLKAEARIVADLDHPHVVRILDVVDDGDGLALVLQYAPGGSLADVLAERGRLAPGEVALVGAKVADALASAHRRGIVHGDVKPENVLLTSDGEPLVTDFGVARVVGAETAEAAGTPGYAAPEVVAGGVPDSRSDVFGLGIVCRQALTGRAPSRRGRATAPALEASEDIPASLAAVVDRAVAPDPAARFGSAEELALALRSSVPPETLALPAPAKAPARSRGRSTRTYGPRPPRADPSPDRGGRPGGRGDGDPRRSPRHRPAPRRPRLPAFGDRPPERPAGRR
jgi:serine/threonine protein kinase